MNPLEMGLIKERIGEWVYQMNPLEMGLKKERIGNRFTKWIHWKWV